MSLALAFPPVDRSIGGVPVDADGPARHGTNRPTSFVARDAALMGGTVRVAIATAAAPGGVPEARRILARIGAWADRLTRFSDASELSRLNADPRRVVPIGPTLGAVFDWGRAAEALTDGLVDIALLDARLAAESGAPAAAAPASARSGSPGSRGWSLARAGRRSSVVRAPGLRFDLDGVAKGWLADRALALVPSCRSAIVDADGDIAVRLAPGDLVEIGIADPRGRRPDGPPGAGHLAVLRLEGSNPAGATSFGVATSGTTVHRWPAPIVGGRQPGPPIHAGRPVSISEAGAPPVRHHLIDPRTRRPAQTDIVQATVIAGSAREAEAVAKAAVIVGSEAALRLLERPGVHGAVLLSAGGDVLALPSTLRWLA